MRRRWLSISLLIGICCTAVNIVTARGQSSSNSDTMPIATRWALDAAGPTGQNSIKSVFLMYCPTLQKKGTSFLLSNGIVVTNNHVVSGCTKDNLVAYSATGKRIAFTNIVTDPERDLALLRPSEKLAGGLELGSDASLPLGTGVSTFGFPLVYNGPAPLLTVGYVAGYRAVKVDSSGMEDNTGRTTVRHMVVNGAFNPGNSGGPVFVARTNKVAAIVVWKWRIASRTVPAVIDSFKHPNAMMSSTLVMSSPDGTSRPVSQQEAIALALEEFYNDVQVMIGEAISVSELRSFMKAKEHDLLPQVGQ